MVWGSRGFDGGYGWWRCRWLHGCFGYPIVENAVQLGDGGELFIMDGSGYIFDSSREEVERMDDAIPYGAFWLGEVLV